MAGKKGMANGRKGKQYVKRKRIVYQISLSAERLSYWERQAAAILGRTPTDAEILLLARDANYSWLDTLITGTW